MADDPRTEEEPLISPDTPTSVYEKSDPLLGRNIGNYTVLSVLGRGGFGAVYEAQDVKLNRRVALKFIQQTSNDFHSHMFEREAQALASLSKHPNIVQIYSWEEFEGKNFFVLEFVGSSATDLRRMRRCTRPRTQGRHSPSRHQNGEHSDRTGHRYGEAGRFRPRADPQHDRASHD